MADTIVQLFPLRAAGLIAIQTRSGEPMNQGLLDVLLIGENPRGWTHLSKTLEHLGCHCWFASTVEEVRALIDRLPIRVVLSSRPITEPGALMKLLRAPERSIYYSCPVEDGCLWFRAFPEIVAAERMAGVRASEFVRTLKKLIAHLTAAGMAISTRLPRMHEGPRNNARKEET